MAFPTDGTDSVWSADDFESPAAPQKILSGRSPIPLGMPPLSAAQAHPLFDYQMQLLLLEEQDRKKRLDQNAREDSTTLRLDDIQPTTSLQDSEACMRQSEQQNEERLRPIQNPQDSSGPFGITYPNGAQSRLCSFQVQAPPANDMPNTQPPRDYPGGFDIHQALQNYHLQVRAEQQNQEGQQRLAQEKRGYSGHDFQTPEGHRDYAMQLRLFGQQNKKRLLLEQKKKTRLLGACKAAADHTRTAQPLGDYRSEQERSGQLLRQHTLSQYSLKGVFASLPSCPPKPSPPSEIQLEDYHMQLMLLEEQNKKRLSKYLTMSYFLIGLCQDARRLIRTGM